MNPTRRATLGAAASVERASTEEGEGGMVGQAYVGPDRIDLKDKLSADCRCACVPELDLTAVL
jgi:hypothetical protein